MSQTTVNPKQEEIKMRAEQAKLDAEASKKLANVS